MVKKYISSITGEVVEVMEYTGRDALEDLAEFTGLRPHDIYSISATDPNAVTCALTPMRDGHYQPQIQLAPGCYIIKTNNGNIMECFPLHFKNWYREISPNKEE